MFSQGKVLSCYTNKSVCGGVCCCFSSLIDGCLVYKKYNIIVVFIGLFSRHRRCLKVMTSCRAISLTSKRSFGSNTRRLHCTKHSLCNFPRTTPLTNNMNNSPRKIYTQLSSLKLCPRSACVCRPVLHLELTF